MFRIFLVLMVFTLPVSALAEAPSFSDKLKNEQAVKASKEVELKTLEKELASTSDKLVDTAKAVQGSEKKLQSLDRRIADLEKEQQELRDKLEGGRGSLSRLVLALERLRRMPPEAMIVKPDTPLKTAQSAMLLRDILPALQKQADELKADLDRLAFVSKDIYKQRDEAASENKTLVKEQKTLNSLMSERKKLYADTHEDIEEQSRKIAHISAQSRTLTELVSKLKPSKPAPKKASAAVNLKPPKAGSPRLPVSGVIVTSFHDTDNFGAPSQGIHIEGREGALVVAPMGGIVRFAGSFKNYGNMIILEHEKGWHSLIAGLEKIDTVVGQSLKVGEPLGTLGKSSSGTTPRLYYELRQNGKAVNPAKKFADLS